MAYREHKAMLGKTKAGEKFPAVVMMGAGWMVVPDIKPGK